MKIFTLERVWHRQFAENTADFVPKPAKVVLYYRLHTLHIFCRRPKSEDSHS